jgi:deazaflavin-dependent oxidoreductase (nitroreductase family)
MSHENRRKRYFVKHFVNPILRNLAHSSRGPFALLRHIGRQSGKRYEIPIMVWPVSDGFIIALTYGAQVDWLRNLQAARQGTLRWHQREFAFQRPEFIGEQAALFALPAFIRFVLRRMGSHEFVKLPEAHARSAGGKDQPV